MGLLNALFDAVKNAFGGGGSDSSQSSSDSSVSTGLGSGGGTSVSGSYDSGSGSGRISKVSIGKSYDKGSVSTTRTNDSYNDSSSHHNDSSAYWSTNNETHNAEPLPGAKAAADRNYQSAYNAYNDFVTQNVGHNLSDGSDYFYQQDLARLQQNLDKAEQTKNYFNPFVSNYKTSAELNGTSADDTRAAAQRAADIANERGQSRTNYLKTYMTEDSNWTKSKYLDENGNRLNSNPLITYDSNDQIPEIPEPRRSAEDEYNRKQQEYMMMNHDNSAYYQAQKDKDATQNLGEWLKNTIGAGATEWASGMIGKAGAVQGAAAAGTEKQYIDMMNEEWQALLKAGYAQAMDDDPRDKESNQNVVDDHMRKLKGYADAIGGGTFEQAYANYEKALEAVLNGEVDIEYALANMNDGVLPDLTTWQQASNATMGLATDVQQQSAEMMQNAKFAAGNTKVGDIATEVLVNNATQIADRLVTGVLTGGLGIAADAAQKAISLGLLYLRSSGSKATEAFNAGADNAQQNLAGDMSGAVEVLTEVLGDYVGNLYGKGIAADAAEETIRRLAKSDIGRTGLRVLNAFKGEFKEEFVSAIVEPAINAVYDAEAADAYKTSEGRTQLLEDALYEGMLGGFGGILGLGESSITSNANANANERLNDIDAIQQNLEDNGMSTKEARAAAPAIHDYQQGEELSGKEKKAINNPIIQSLYGIDKSQIDAVEAAIKRGEITREDVKAMLGASPDIIKEANKPRDNDKIDADIAAFNNHAQELATASVGDVVLDAENNPVATVTEVNDHGITVEFEDGHKNSAVFVGNNGLLAADSDLAKALGKDGEGAIVNAEEAKIFAQEAAAKRKAQEEAKSAAAKTPQQTTDSGTGTVAQQKPTVGERSTTGENKAEAHEPQAPKAEATTSATNPLVQEERSTSGEERAEQQEPEAPKSKAQQFFDENPQKGRVYTSDYKGATVKIKNNGDGTYTVSMASPLKNGTGFTKAAKPLGTVSSIDEANQLVVDEYNKRNPGQKAFGETLGITSENASESPVSASPETGNSVPTQAQESTDTANETLNNGSEEEAAPEAEEYSEEDMVDEDEWDDEEDYDYNVTVTEEEANNYRTRADETFSNELDEAFKSKGYLTENDIASATNAANSVFDSDTNNLSNFKTTEDVFNALQNAISRATESGDQSLANYLSELYQTVSTGKSVYDDVYSGKDGIENIPNEDIAKAFRYIDAFAKQIANENPDKPLFRQAQNHDNNPGITHGQMYLPQVIKADLLRQTELAKQNKSSAKTDNKLDGTKPIDEDDKGNKLPKNVANFFRNSKLRDALGRLRTFFHGTTNLLHKHMDFNYADDGLTMWLASDANTTSSYAGTQREASYFDQEIGELGVGEELDSVTFTQEQKNETIQLFEDLYKSGLSGDGFTQPADAKRAYDDAMQLLKQDKLEYTAEEIYEIDANANIISTLSTVNNNSDWLKISSSLYYNPKQNNKPITGKQANVPVYVNMENPLVVDGEGAAWNEIPIDQYPEIMQVLGYIGRTVDRSYYGDYTARTRDIALAAYALGYDGVLIQNILDFGGGVDAITMDDMVDYEKTADVLAVFNSNQVKDVKNENPTKSDDFRLREFDGYDIQASKDDPTLGMRVDNTTGKRTKVPRTTVAAEVVEKALYGGTVDKSISNYEGTLTEEEVNKLTPRQVIQRLQNYARRARTSLRGLIRHIAEDETGISDRSLEHTRQFIEENVSGSALNASGEFEDEVDIVGGEDDTRKERTKQSVEEMQEEANEVRKAHLELLGDAIRSSLKSSEHSKYPTGIDGIADQILDSRSKDGIIYTAEQHDAFKQLLKDTINKEWRKQNGYPKDKKGNPKDANFKKLTIAEVLDILDNSLAESAELDNLSNEEFTEIDALLQRVDDMKVGYGSKKGSASHVYTGYQDLRDILEGRSQFTQDLKGAIYDEANLTGGEQWVTDEDGNEVKISDAEGWRENPRYENDTTDYDDGKSYIEQYEDEQAYIESQLRGWVNNTYAQRSEQTGKGSGAIETIMPTVVNGKTNPRLTGDEIVRKNIQTYTSKKSINYIIQVGENMFRHFIDSNMSPKIKSVIDSHKKQANEYRNSIKSSQQYVDTLKAEIKDRQTRLDSLKSNPLSANTLIGKTIPGLEKAISDLTSRVQAYEKGIATTQKKLAIEEEWLNKVEKGFDKGKGKNESYTLKDFLNDKTKDIRGKDLITQEEKDSIGIKTFIDPKTGFREPVYGGFKFNALANAEPRTLAKEVIDFIKEGVEDGTLTEQGYFPAGETAQLSNGTGVVVSESGQYTNNGYYGELSPADARAEAEELSNSRLRGDSNWLGENDTGADGRLSGEQGAEGQGSRSSEAALLRSDAQVVADEYNNSPVTQINVLGRNKGKITTGTVTAKEIATGYYITGDASALDSSEYTDEQTKSQAKLCEDAAIELNTSVVTYKGGLYRDIGNGKTKRIWGFARPDGTIVIPSFKDAATNRAAAKTTAHELTHQYTEEVFDGDGQKLVSFVKGVFKKAGIDFDLMADILRPIYGNFNTVFGTGDAVIADEIVAYLMEGSTLDGALDMNTVATLRNALLSTKEFSNLDQKGYSAYVQLCNVASAALAGYGNSDPGKTKGFSLLNQSQEQRDANALYNATAWKQGNTEQRIDDIRFANSNPTGADYNALPYQYRNEARNASTRYGDVGLKSAPTEAERKVGENKRDLGYRLREYASDDISPMDDESFQNLIDQEDAYNNAALGEGTPIDQQDMDSLVNEASADEINLLNSRGGNVSAEDTGRFNNLIDQASASERETLNDLRNNSEDITNASEGSFDNLVDTENQSIEDALNAGAESSANQYPERRFKDAKDYYGKAYDEVVSKVATKHARANSRSSFTHEDIYNKLYGNAPNAHNNFRRLQKLNTNIDSLLKGKMSAQAFNAFAKNMAGEQGIGQILNDDIQREFAELAKLEEKATGGDQRESDVINFQYAAADAVAHLCARMDMVEKTERARAKLDSLAKKHGKTNKKAIGNAVDWWNRMQISGDNFWRMAGNWDAESRNQGYALAQEHNKCIATRISEEAKLKDYFSGIDKKSKQFRDFANGTTMSNVDFEGHKISLMEAVKFVKICDTMRAFANENRRPDWQRVAALGGFAFEGKDGKPVFVDIQGSKKNNGAKRVEWVQKHYDAAMAEIQANKAASEYMKACEEMYWDASQTAEKVHSKVNGYQRYMYGKGKYTDIHYANKNGTVDFSYKDRDAIDVHDTGIMQKRTRVNGGYVICNPMSRSIDAYISQISNYIAFEEFGQKLGVLNDNKSINGNYANTVGDAYGSQYSQWFDNYVKSMTLYRETDPKKLKDKALQKARQAMMTGALSLSVSVPIKQVSSFFDTMGMLDPRAVNRVFLSNPSGKKVKGINNYLYQSRGQSISDPDLAELFGDKGMLGKFKNTKVGKVVMSATNMMDEKAVSNVYLACVYDTELNTLSADKLYKNGKNFKDGLTSEGQFYVDSKFEQVLLGTQPIFTPQARNELARTDNQLLRMFQTFRTQQTQNYNRALQSLSEWKAASKNGGDTSAAFKKVRQTVQGQLTASVSLAALNAIATTLLHKHHKYKDDDDEFDKEKFWKRFGLDALESFLGNALWLGDLTKWAIDKADISDSREFYGVASGALGTAWTIGTSAVDLYRNIQEDGWTQSNKVSARYLAGNVATAFGKPLNNAYAMINAGWQWYADLAGIDRKYDDIFLQWAYVTDTPQNRLANAILKGDNDQIADLIDEIGEDKLTNTVSYGALDKYKQGKIDEAEYVDILMSYANMSYKDASKEVQKKKALIDSGISQYNGIDGRDGRAAFYDQYSDRFESRNAYKDFFADVKAGKEDGKHKTYYTTYNGKQQEVTANQSSIIDRMNERIKAGTMTYDTAKLLWENYYGYSSSKWSAWQYVGR